MSFYIIISIHVGPVNFDVYSCKILLLIILYYYYEIIMMNNNHNIININIYY